MSSRPRILIVDDEPELSTSLKGCLGYKNYEIATAKNGKEAVELFNTCDFDLVLLDVVMPGMSGYQVMNYIHEKKPDIPIVLMTAYAPVDFTAEDLPQGAHSYLIKPFDLDQLVTTVQRALNKG
jgi:DNA-binding NtrC family response regulator